MYGLVDDFNPTDALDDRNIIARTIYGEARGEGEDGMQAVANVIQNRLASGIRWWGHTLRTICLARWQFSCWNATDPNRPKLLAVPQDDPQFRAALQLADQVLAGTLPDITNGATSYFAPAMGRKPPAWTNGVDPCRIIGKQWFYV